MKKIITASLLAVLALSMLLPVACQVNAASVNQSAFSQAPGPLPGGTGGGHFTLSQAPGPLPGGTGGGH